MTAARRKIRAVLAAGARNQTDDLPHLVEQVSGDADALAEVVAGTTADEEALAARSAWVLRRVAEADARPLARHRAFLVEKTAASEFWEVRAELCHILPRLRLTERQLDRALEFLRAGRADASRIVQAWSLDALSKLAEERDWLRPEAQKLLLEGLESPYAAVRARARNLLVDWEKRYG